MKAPRLSVLLKLKDDVKLPKVYMRCVSFYIMYFHFHSAELLVDLQKHGQV